MKIQTNIQSMAAQRQMKKSSAELQNESQRLASGDRIYQAAFDPSGLAISSKMQAKIRSQSQAQRNINDGVSLIQVAEGALSGMHDMGARLMELSIAAANDTVGASERAMIAREFDSTKDEYNRIKQAASFNGKSLLDGGKGYELQVGTENDPNADRMYYDMENLLSNDFGIERMSVLTKVQAQESAQLARGMISEISRSRAKLGSVTNRMGAALENLQISSENLQRSNSKIRDTDVAESASKRAIAQITNSAATSTLAQANTTPENALKLL